MAHIALTTANTQDVLITERGRPEWVVHIADPARFLAQHDVTRIADADRFVERLVNERGAWVSGIPESRVSRRGENQYRTVARWNVVDDSFKTVMSFPFSQRQAAEDYKHALNLDGAVHTVQSVKVEEEVEVLPFRVRECPSPGSERDDLWCLNLMLPTNVETGRRVTCSRCGHHTVLLDQTSTRTVPFAGNQRFKELIEQVSRLIPGRYDRKDHVGSISWLGWRGSDWQGKTLVKLGCYSSCFRFGVREDFALPIPGLADTVWSERFTIDYPGDDDVIFLGCQLDCEGTSLDEVRRICSYL